MHPQLLFPARPVEPFRLEQLIQSELRVSVVVESVVHEEEQVLVCEFQIKGETHLQVLLGSGPELLEMLQLKQAPFMKMLLDEQLQEEKVLQVQIPTPYMTFQM